MATKSHPLLVRNVVHMGRHDSGRTEKPELSRHAEQSLIPTWAESQGVALWAGQLILVARQAAEEDGAADAEDGGSPAEAVGPGVVVVALEELLVEFDRVDDESDDLDDHCRATKRGVSWLLMSLTWEVGGSSVIY
ncbi:hypothetical protein EYF80_025470 [Liparis tanakae]|uniref:Uncharacterized protein n=1 Tax=Liparis tanakae TaxID=230148 RepID=A0A4Z2HFN4_9TELE|nr:hypothetical protein EYF80_025470 [Liparis tanakae]